MKKFTSQFKKIAKGAQRLGVGAYHRVWGLAKRLDPSRIKKDKKK